MQQRQAPDATFDGEERDSLFEAVAMPTAPSIFARASATQPCQLQLATSDRLEPLPSVSADQALPSAEHTLPEAHVSEPFVPPPPPQRDGVGSHGLVGALTRSVGRLGAAPRALRRLLFADASEQSASPAASTSRVSGGAEEAAEQSRHLLLAATLRSSLNRSSAGQGAQLLEQLRRSGHIPGCAPPLRLRSLPRIAPPTCAV